MLLMHYSDFLPRSCEHRSVLVAAGLCALACNAVDGSTATVVPGTPMTDAALDAGVDAGPPMLLSSLPDRGALHVDIGTQVDYEDNPPASGNHYPVWTSFDVFDEPVPREYWVHSLEHGGIALLYGPGATDEQRSELRALYDDLPADPSCGHARALMTEDPALEVAVAVVAWRHVLAGDVIDPQAIVDFVLEYRAQAPEDLCADGSYTP